MTRRGWLVLGVLSAPLILGVAWRAFAARPLLDEDEIREAGAIVSAALEDARHARCERPVLRGAAIEGDGSAAFRALVDPDGVHRACWSLASARRDAIVSALVQDAAPADATEVELPPEPPRTHPAEGPALDPDWTYPSFGRVLHLAPLAVESEILAACAGIDVEITRVAQHASVCTPGPIGEATGTWELVALAQVVAIFARDRLRTGDRIGGMHLTLDGLRLAADAMRGRPALMTTVMGDGASMMLFGQLQSFLAADLAFEDDELAHLEDEALVLARTLPSITTAWIDDRLIGAVPSLRVRGWTPPEGVTIADEDEEDVEDGDALDAVFAEAMVAVAAHAETRRASLECASFDDRRSCRDAWRREIDDTAGDGAPSWRFLFGPRAARDELIAGGWAESVRVSAPALDRRLQTEAITRSLWVAIEHRRTALRTRACPDVADVRAMLGSPSGLAAQAGFGGAFTAYRAAIAYEPIDVAAPSWIVGRGDDVRLPVFELYCPTIAPAP